MYPGTGCSAACGLDVVAERNLSLDPGPHRMESWTQPETSDSVVATQVVMMKDGTSH